MPFLFLSSSFSLALRFFLQDVNPAKEKELSNMRSTSKEEMVRLTPPRRFNVCPFVFFFFVSLCLSGADWLTVACVRPTPAGRGDLVRAPGRAD